MELTIINPQGQPSGSVAVADAVFGRDFNETLVHQAVVAFLAGSRAGTRSQKSRSEVRGGGAKPWRQKGTGRARAGTIRSPLWRGGGVTFAAKPQSHTQKLNRRMYRGAMRSILSELVRQERLVVVNELTVAEPKTKLGVALLNDFGVAEADRILLVVVAEDAQLSLAMRNLSHVTISTVTGLNPMALVASDRVVVTQAALDRIEEWLG